MLDSASMVGDWDPAIVTWQKAPQLLLMITLL